MRKMKSVAFQIIVVISLSSGSIMRQMAICGVPDLNKFLENMPENAQIENVLCVKLIKKS